MDSGLGSIGRKIIKPVRRIAIGYWHWQQIHPVKNAAWLITWLTTFFIVNFYFIKSSLLFENDWLGLFAIPFFFFTIFYAMPGLLFLNSFWFRRSWQRIINAVVWGTILLHMTVILVLMLIMIIFLDDGTSSLSLVRRTTTPNGEILSLYQRDEGHFSHCRYLMSERRVFPGILRHEAELKKDCHGTEDGPFPPELQ
jgi:hypothetical protein